MKKIVFVFCFLSLIVGLCSCEGNKNALEPDNHIWVLKLSKAEYKNFVIASIFAQADSIVLVRYNHMGEPVGRSGYSPYWELPDEWLLIDWKWHNFPYLGNEVLLLDVPWEDCTHMQQCWSKEVPHVDRPVNVCYMFKTKEIAAFLHKDYSNLIGYIEPNYFLAEEMGKEAFIAKKDSVWTILQQDLSAIINDNSLNKVSISKPYTNDTDTH